MAGGSFTASHFKQAEIFKQAEFCRSGGEPQDQFCSQRDKYFHARCVFISWACLGLFF